MGQEQRNLELMQTLDDAWNAQDWDTFDKRHRHDVIVRWPAQSPTNGRHDHRAESIRLFKTFPDNRVHNRPYKTLFASGDWTCSIARFTGTMKGPMAGPNGVDIPATGNVRGRFLHRCPVERRWRNHRGEPLLRFTWPDAPSRNWLIPLGDATSWPNGLPRNPNQGAEVTHLAIKLWTLASRRRQVRTCSLTLCTGVLHSVTRCSPVPFQRLCTTAARSFTHG